MGGTVSGFLGVDSFSAPNAVVHLRNGVSVGRNDIDAGVYHAGRGVCTAGCAVLGAACLGTPCVVRAALAGAAAVETSASGSAAVLMC